VATACDVSEECNVWVRCGTTSDSCCTWGWHPWYQCCVAHVRQPFSTEPTWLRHVISCVRSVTRGFDMWYYKCLKELCHQLNIFFKGLQNLNQYFLDIRKWFLNFLPDKFWRKINMKFLFISLKHLLILFRLSFTLIGKFLLVNIHSRVSEQFSESQLVKAQAAIRKPEQALWIAWLKGVSQFVSDFVKVSRTKRQLKIVKTISAHSKSTVSNFRNSKKNIHLVTFMIAVMRGTCGSDTWSMWNMQHVDVAYETCKAWKTWANIYHIWSSFSDPGLLVNPDPGSLG
jgi:hypothetical protein